MEHRDTQKIENTIKMEKTKVNSAAAKTERKPPNVIARLFFCWMCPLFYAGNRRDLEEEDLVPAKKIYNSTRLGDKLELKWFEEEKEAKRLGRAPSFSRALRNTFFLSYLYPGFLTLLQVALRSYQPLLLADLLTYWSPDTTVTQNDAIFYAGMIALISWVGAFLNHHAALINQQFGMQVRVATGSVMYRKIMRMNNGSLGEMTAGKIVNLLANDLSRFDLVFMFLHYLWIVPIQVAVVVYLAWMQAGLAAIIGIIALVLIPVPAQGGLSRLAVKLRQQVAVRSDSRIKTMNEVINGIRVIKMYAWEIPFEKVVDAARALELKAVRKASFVRSIFVGFMIFTERTALFITVLAYSLLGNQVTASVIYPVQQFLQIVQLNIAMFLPLAISFGSEMIVSLRRVEEFLVVDERPDLSVTGGGAHSAVKMADLFAKMKRDEEPVSILPIKYEPKGSNAGIINPSFTPTERPQFTRSVSMAGEVAVEVKDLSASWVGDPSMMALKNISLRLRQGKLCAIIGAVGSGKSSFLQLLLKELPAASGSVSVTGSMSYASQEPWLFPSSVRDNILFGQDYDARKYKKVCKACALEKDFTQFPHGDQTLVGERGVSLSGGQRARINLARACYREADVYLLDDPLSAVDANVGRQLFDGCISAYLRGRTRILVTHQIHYLKTADFIIVLNEGSVENMGTYEDLVSSGKEFAMLLKTLEEGKDSDSESVGSDRSGGKRSSLKRGVSVVSEEEAPAKEHEVQTAAAEQRASGQLKWEVVSAFFNAGGSWFALVITVVLILMTQGSAAGADYFLSFWMNQAALQEETVEEPAPEFDLHDQIGRFTTSQYLIIHGSIMATCIILTHVRIIAFVNMCVTASKNLHNWMFRTMLRGVMRFFDTSDSGRILNRFSKDIGAVDEILPRTLLDVIQIYGSLISILILNALALYWTLVPTAVLLVIFFIMVKVYLNAAQAVKRLEGTTKSPVFGIVTSTLQGIATIRSSGAQDRLIHTFDTSQDLHTSAWNCFLGGGSTFGFYLDSLCVFYLILIMATFLFLDLDGVVPVGSVGLAVTQSLVLTAMLQHGARMLVESIGQLTSVERVLEYTRITEESNLFNGQTPMPKDWPSKGEVVFKNVNLRYAPNEPPVLKNLNVVIQSGWKVGIVGRTGAGKSSLISALFRFADLEGTMLIDGLDTSLVSRQELRTKISIIPQEPVLFSATLRYNLDPFDLYSDDEIWRALEQVDLKSAVPALDFKVTEGGSNFSVGQRQLVCLARAVLRSNKILIMDEATANVDPQTDSFIQQTIRSQFASCTVLTIAHRLNTIMDSDRVLVMDTGEVAEYDHPFILLSDPNSHLSRMVRETGESMTRQLFEVAREAFYQSNPNDIS